MKYVYFISYTYDSQIENVPVDNTILTVENEVRTAADVEALEAIIAKNENRTGVTIITFQVVGRV
jgi:hypothetical protein